MDVALPSFILGYHGCDESLAEAVFAGRERLDHSTNDYDWLGHGVYFWEHNAQRAYDYAKTLAANPRHSKQRIAKPAVIGAVINLGYCLNLLDGRFIELVRKAHRDLEVAARKANRAMPQNTGGKDLLNRKLDCMVIQTLHAIREDKMESPFDTVRAAFIEGDPLYENAGFTAESHIQVCVRNPQCIMGYFRPLDDEGNVQIFQ